MHLPLRSLQTTRDLDEEVFEKEDEGRRERNGRGAVSSGGLHRRRSPRRERGFSPGDDDDDDDVYEPEMRDDYRDKNRNKHTAGFPMDNEDNLASSRRPSPMTSDRLVSPSRGGMGEGRGNAERIESDNAAGNDEENGMGRQLQVHDDQHQPRESMYPTVPSPTNAAAQSEHQWPSAPILPKLDPRKVAELKEGKLGLKQGNQAYKDLMKPRKSLG
jgi:hypothetical protein